ncbi:Hypothetical predicted protein, partial [Marmota monax]
MLPMSSYILSVTAVYDRSADQAHSRYWVKVGPLDPGRCHCKHLEHNSLVEVNSGSLFGLTALHHLHLVHNSISCIHRGGWNFCQKLRE